MKFSIVVPVYNTEPAYFHQCMESILGQDYRERYEVILIDDGSTTDIGRICDEYGQRDSRVVVVHQENRGVSEARNQGICNSGTLPFYGNIQQTITPGHSPPPQSKRPAFHRGMPG